MRRILMLFLILYLACLAPNLKAQTPTPNPQMEQLSTALLSAETDAQREKLLAENKPLLTVELGAALLQKGRQFIGKNDFPNAERAFNLSLKVSEFANDKKGSALALRNLGSVNGMQGNFKSALDYFQKAVAAYELSADETGTARALIGVGNAQNALGNYEASIAAFRQSAEIYERFGDKEGMANAYSSLNIIYQYTGGFDRAANYGERGLKLARENGGKTAIATALASLATLAKSRGDLRAALTNYDEALRIFEQENDLQRLGGVLNNVGGIYLAQGDYDSAEDYFRRGLTVREKIGDKDGIARSNLRLGNLKILQNDFPAALAFVNRSLALREGEAKDPASLAEAVNALGDVYFKTNDLTKAGEFYERSLKISETVGDREGIAVILVTLARFHLTAGDREKASAEANRAVEIAMQLNLREPLWEAQTIAGEVALAANDKIRARQSFESAIKTIEESRLLVAGGERERQQFFESKIKPYHAVIELLIGEKRFEEAFTYAERAKARVLLDVMQNGHAQPNKAMTAPEQVQETKLRKAIFAIDTQLQIEAAKEKPDAARLDELKKELGKARNALDSFTTLLYVAHPELKLQRGAGDIANLSDLGKILPNENAALLEFVVTENKTFIFLISPDRSKPKLDVIPIEIRRGVLTKMIADFRDKISRRDLRFGDDAKKIYNLFLAPVARQIENKNRLIISPDAALWELPFQALVDGQNKYVVETAAVSYAPSLSVLAAITNRQNKPSADSTLLAFGNPAYKTTNLTDEKTARPVLMNDIFADLPEAERQVKALFELYGARQSVIFTGAKATETEFKKSAGNFKILHLATHGVLDDTSPLYSYVLLKNDNGEDGRLEAREVMQMNLKANLVVLSACESGRGRIGAGEGLVGLSWAFFVAGSPTTIASQWKVESASTTELMLGFYRGLQNKSISKAESLRQSSLILLKNGKYAHPFYWAGFIVVGNGN